jgi:predicted PilT family ATPase
MARLLNRIVMKIYIKNMVCQGTRFFVLHELEKLGLEYDSFELGEIDFVEELSMNEIKALDESLHKYGLELILRESSLVSKIRNVVLDLIENNIPLVQGMSYYILKRVMGYNYAYLNKYFTKETGLPIEEYYFEKKSENVRLNEQTWTEALNSLGESA